MCDLRERSMRRIQKHICLAAPGDKRRNHQHRAARFLQPAIPKTPARQLTGIVPANHSRNTDTLYPNFDRNLDFDHRMRPRNSANIRMHKHFQNRPGKGLGCVDYPAPGRIPSPAIKPRAGRVIQWKTRVGYAKAALYPLGLRVQPRQAGMP